MWEEDNEAVEAVQSEAVEAPAAETSVEASVEAPVDAVAAPDGGGGGGEAAPEVFDWNGELESLRMETWYNKLDEPMRQAMDRGVESKYNNWARGYQKKFDEVATQRRDVERLYQNAKTKEQEVMKWFHGDVDPMVEKQKELDNMTLSHQAAIAALRDQAEAQHEKAKTAYGGDLEEAVKSRDHAINQTVELQGQLDEFNKAITEREVDQLDKFLVDNAEDVYKHNGAFDEFLEQWKQGKSPDVAIKIARAVYDLNATPEPEPVPEPEPEPEAVPEGMRLMNMRPDTAAATQGGEPRSFEEIMLSRKLEAQREADLIRNA